MSIAQQAARITSLRDELRDILKELGLADEQYKLEQCVEAVRNMPKISAEDTVLDINNTEKQIDKGYHPSEGRVHIVTEEKNRYTKRKRYAFRWKSPFKGNRQCG